MPAPKIALLLPIVSEAIGSVIKDKKQATAINLVWVNQHGHYRQR